MKIPVLFLLAFLLSTPGLATLDPRLETLERTPIFSATGASPGDRLGNSIANIGDINGDSVDDLAVGSSNFSSTNVHPNEGKVVVYSGRDGSILYSFTGAPSVFPSPPDVVGIGVSGVGDRDHDGVPDFAFCSSFEIVVISGRTHQRIFQVYPLIAGISSAADSTLTADQDIDGDGVNDFLVGSAPVTAYSGTGSWVHSYTASLPRTYPFNPGHAATVISDINQDGWKEIVVGGSFGFASGNLIENIIVIYDGQTGQVLHEISEFGNPPTYTAFGMGTYLKSWRDYNNDGFVDFVAGSPAHNTIKIFSGRTFQPIKAIQLPTGTGRYLTSFSNLGDINLDGFDDLGISQGNVVDPTTGSNKFQVHLYSGKDLQKLHTLKTPFAVSTMTKGPDQNFDGIRELGIASPSFSESNPQQSFVGKMALVPTYGFSMTGTVPAPELQTRGIFFGIGYGAFASGIEFSGGPANASGLVIYSRFPINGMGGLPLLVDFPNSPLALPASSSLYPITFDATGRSIFPYMIPLAAQLVVPGEVIYAQALALDANANTYWSRRVEIGIMP